MTSLIILSIIISLIGLIIINTCFYLAYAANFSDNLNQQSARSIANTRDLNNDNYGNSANYNIGSNNNTISFIDKIHTKKVTVGDIDIAYKSFGIGKPILLISGSGNVMEFWPLHLLQKLSSTHKVFIFDNRGVGNTTSGIKPFSINQFANDTVSLMNALNIKKADIFGFSMGSFIAQQLVITHPEKVNRLILYGASCGGQQGNPQEPWVVNALYNFVNNQTQDTDSFLSVTFPLKWIKNNPSFFDKIQQTSQIVTSTTLKKQFDINENWLSKEWSGVCNQLTKITQPTLIITGTNDVAVPADNSIIITEKIPGAWLVQIKDAGHGLMYQYPYEFTKIIETFLNVTDKQVVSKN